MRKLACLILVIALLAPALALAEDVSLTTYTNANNGYSIGYPEDWTLLSKDTIDDVMGKVTSGEIPGIDTSAIAGMKAQIEALDMMMCMSPDGAINYNVTYIEMPMELTNDMIIQMVLPATQQQLATVFSDVEAVDAGSEQEIGGNKFASASYRYAIGDMGMLCTVLAQSKGNLLYTITFTFNTSLVTDIETLEPTLDAIATSFVPAA